MPRTAVLLSAAVLALAGTCSGASAHLIVVGSPLKGEFKSQKCDSPTGTLANTSLAEAGANASSPVNGAVVDWRMLGDFSSGKPFELRILRPAPGGAYVGMGTSAQEIANYGLFTAPSFRAAVPIKAGDLIGINLDNDCVGTEAVPGSNYANWSPALGEGSPLAPATGKNVEIGVRALVQPAPTATSISPAASALGGGGVATIRGTDFEEASAVSFGGVPVTDFSVESGAQITAVVPSATKPGPVPVSVTTIAGTATVPQTLDYQACLVPSLKGKPLAAAKKAVRAAGCALGRVAHRRAAKANHGAKPKVVAQGRPAGKTLPFGAKIDLTVRG